MIERRKHMPNNIQHSKIKLAIGVLLLFIVFVAALKLIRAYPFVTFSHETGECVRVYPPESEYSCDNLPPRYERGWVK